jgi:hypothetical protein
MVLRVVLVVVVVMTLESEVRELAIKVTQAATVKTLHLATAVVVEVARVAQGVTELAPMVVMVVRLEHQVSVAHQRRMAVAVAEVPLRQQALVELAEPTQERVALLAEASMARTA